MNNFEKVYLKQKGNSLKSDCFKSLQDDFTFMGEVMNDDQITSIPKNEYRKLIKQKVQRAAFLDYLSIKERSNEKMKALKYKTFGSQSFIISIKFSFKQIRLLFSLRSNYYSAKMNFSKMNRGNLNCIFFATKKKHKPIFLRSVSQSETGWIVIQT